MNKYKNKANNLHIRDGEVALTYGVKYYDEGEGNNKIKPARPYFVIKKIGDVYYSLKLTTKNNKYLDDFKIEANKYPQNKSLIEDSFVDPGHIYELEIGDFIQPGVVLSKRDQMCIYNKLIKEYVIEKIDINQELLKIIYPIYISHKEVVPGMIFATRTFNGHLLVLDVDDSYYKCLPVFRDGDFDYDESFKFYKYNNYVHYSYKYYLPKSEIIYITNFGINPSVFNYIQERVAEREEQEKGLEEGNILKC